MDVISKTKENRLVSILRDVSESDVSFIGEALVQGGVRLVEVSFSSALGVSALRKLSTDLKGELSVGAGTVYTLGAAKLAVENGAEFLISPGISEPVMRYAVDNKIPVFPGVMTPSEIIKALEYDVQVVKLFPAGTLGPQYIKELRGPFPDIEIMPVGGVTVENIPLFKKVGCNVFGIGSSLVKRGATKDDALAITEQAKVFARLVAEV